MSQSVDGLSGNSVKLEPFETGTKTDEKNQRTSTESRKCSESHTESEGNDRVCEIRTHRREQNIIENEDEKCSSEKFLFTKEDRVDASDSSNQAKDCCNLSIHTDAQNVSISGKDSEVCKTGIDELLELFPFICGICDEKYNKISRYLAHVASHAECKEDFFHICLERERTGGNILAKNDQIEIFLCGLCDKVFETVCHLHEHLIKTEETKKYIYDESTHTAYKYSIETTGDEVSNSEMHPSNNTENRMTSRTSSSCINQRNTDVDEINKEVEDTPVPSTNYSFSAVANTNEDENSCPSQTDAGKYKVVKLEVLDGVGTSESYGNNDNAMMTKDKCDSQLDTETNNDKLHFFKQTKSKKTPGTRKRKSQSNKRKIGIEKMVKTKSKVKQEESLSSSDSINTELDVAGDAILDNTDDKASMSKLLVTIKTKKNRESERTLKPCQVCGKMYKSNNLRKHEYIHKDTRDCECEICHKTFKGRHNLHCHKISHREELNYTCDICGKAFKTLAYVKQHRKTHTAERNLSCPMCPEKFMEKKVLEKHMSVHSDVRSHVCETCGKAFKRIDFLTMHKKSHSEARPFPCKICGKTFKSHRDCKKHEMIHEPPRHFCPVCNKGFVTNCNRKIHMKVHAK